jgi:aspartate/methionine/tyrosine aminotransferase
MRQQQNSVRVRVDIHQIDKSGQQKQSRERGNHAIRFRLAHNHFRNRNRDYESESVIIVAGAEFGFPKASH